ncbi:capsular exopolysaccharide synthesis family protein [Gelidibacter sediminis]|uniref:non-specific protein-tyrosine kinase n=1 Tax=Gelidibacter sediminis TaxID=1608710 RepID=A0A4V3F939_9FLAO|nr:tyrosine-protein kinase family protein [Gelidibacter sediminis]TDU42876.1 capsular exopolysaccharide synthesis family protein [Gelidibacter sediminis]
MDNSFNTNAAFEDESNVDLKQEIRKYLRFWPWFVLTLGIALFGAYFYLRYAPRIYQTSATMKILDKSDGLELPTQGFVFKRSNINLENEIQILTSYRILEKVARDLMLNTRFFEEGTIQTTEMAELPFVYEQVIHTDSIKNGMSYVIEVKNAGFEILESRTDQKSIIPNHNTFRVNNTFPFQLKIEDKESLKKLVGKKYIISYGPLRNAALSLKSKIAVEPIGQQSDLLELTVKGQSKEISEKILNGLMGVFNQDGIRDRQSVSKRTLDFIDERFVFLAQELDSIEVSYRDFKQENNVIDIKTDAELGLQLRSASDEEVFRVENQLALEGLLKEALTGTSSNELLPNNIGLESGNINGLINEYNSAIQERDKLVSSGGKNNPTVQLIQSQIDDLKANISRSLNSYHEQLIMSQRQLRARKSKFVGQVAQIPQKEKLLKSIERQQQIKQSLYLLLLTKREEAAINLAITEPSIKVVDYALTSSGPISPKSNIIYAGAVLGGLLVPFGILYLIFMLNTKVQNKEDIIKVNNKVPVIGEIPDMKKNSEIVFEDPNASTVLAESFRILSSNVEYILPVKNDNKGKVIYCTSTIKGEGKTYVSINLSLALSSINRRVLLIGADLRNPQIHTHIKEGKDNAGLSNYLHDPDFDWKSSLVNGFEKHPNHHILLSGDIPPNPAHLLTNGRFTKLIEEAKEEYDYIIVDTAPTILVTDTMLISQLADATVYLARANFTDKNLLKFSKELAETGKLKNMAYVINGVGASKSYGYSYNYGYGYGYGNEGEN